MNSLTSQIYIQILRQEMGLKADRIWIRDQNRLIPQDKGLFVIVGFVSGFTVSNVTFMEQQTETQHQISQVQIRENIQIDIMSRSNEALERQWEIIAAMQSFYSQQLQELNNFKIFRIPQSFINSSFAEGGSLLNRFTIVMPALVWYRKDTLLASPLGDYYDDFKTRVDDAKTIGTDEPLIEFEITSEGILP